MIKINIYFMSNNPTFSKEAVTEEFSIAANFDSKLKNKFEHLWSVVGNTPLL
ncbi:MAG: hypothetical protein M9916_07490 [Crocinitomicaceae bacterium]|nr:hypothetical protein [Crocinitomicaceae bacterium]